MPVYLNISTYRFAPLRDLKPLRSRLQEKCKAWGLKGTILLSSEGINLFVAGEEGAVHALLAELRAIPGLEDLTPKISPSDHQPFNRMLIRIKKEIIAFGIDSIDPARHTSPRLPPKELKRWLDEGKEVILLDTRNDYEIKLGTFAKAQAIGVKHFRDFPAAVDALPPDWKTKPVVTFCTGGIRCEKAAPYLESQGFRDIFQLDGGILNYFAECGSAHYEGDCFVFDQRVGVDPSLHESRFGQCFACLTPLSETELQSPLYQVGVSCPYCFKSSEAQMQASLERRHATIAQAADPLPGAEPRENRRPFRVPAKWDGLSLLDCVCSIVKHIGQPGWQQEFANGRVVDGDGNPADPSRKVKAGERYFHLYPIQAEPPVNPAIHILYEDEALLVLEKPAPLPVHAGGRFSRNTLQYFLNRAYAPQHPHPAHRLDANTTGLLLVARTRHFAGQLQPQFSRGEIEKQYVVKVLGHPPEDRFVCDLPISETTSDVGARQGDEQGLSARTEFEVLERRTDGSTLLQARPITGRTNQIRVHLWELGWPVAGDQLYLPGRRLGAVQTGDVSDARLCLHSSVLEFTHPLTSKRVRFESSPDF
jgi:UPF0176 protein